MARYLSAERCTWDISQAPFPFHPFSLFSCPYHITAHQVSPSSWFFRASEWTGSGTQPGSHVQQAQSKGKSKIRADKAWPNRLFSPLQITHCSGTSDTQQQPLLQPGIRKAPIKHLAICFSQAEHSTAGCSSINVKCWLSKARLLNHNLTIYSLCRQHEYCTSSECGAATPEHACLAATHIS